MIKRNNYHSHTSRCNHAVGLDEDYVLSAIMNNFEIYGFSDHSPWPLHDNENNNIRMKLEELDDYISSVRQLQEKYAGQITILLGLECEYFEDRMEWLRNLKKEKGLDYLVFGNHFHKYTNRESYIANVKSEDALKNYLDDSIKGLESGVYDVFAHPDIYMRNCGSFTPYAKEVAYQICLKAKECNVPLEFNMGGFRANLNYPCEDFFMVASEVGNEVIIGGDYHHPLDMNDELLYHKALELLMNLDCNIIYKLDLK
ncbi:MAG: histidinol-phosphatase [Erysipelotrichaceae bacterium]